MPITTIIFDVDDCLYDVGTGFTAHRNTDGVVSHMVENQYLNFASREEAQAFRDVYFERYHSTAKALTAAENDGELPPLPKGVSLPPGREKRFIPDELDEHWAATLKFNMLGGVDPRRVDALQALKDSGLHLVAFSNGPRKYCCKVLRTIGLFDFFGDENIFAVTDVLPHCKPDRGSFDFVLGRIGKKPEECVMVEDSMKNIRAAKSLGLKTILVCGEGRKGGRRAHDGRDEAALAAEATKPGDAPDESDPAVDATIEVASEVADVILGWLKE